MKAVSPADGITLLSFAVKVRHYLTSRSQGAKAMLRHGAEFYEDVWRDAARQAGATVRDVGQGVLDINLGARTLRVCSNKTSLDDPVTDQVASDKRLVHRLLVERGLPVPRHLICSSRDLSGAWRFLGSTGGPAVVKPAWGTSGGRGVTVGVTGRLSLTKAMIVAGAFCDDVLIEELVEGDDYRLVYFDGELLDAVLRRPPTVMGDGTSTLAELIRQENESRLRDGVSASRTLVGIDSELKTTLRGQGRMLTSVPGQGERVKLKRVVNDNRGDDNEAAGKLLCRSVIEAGATAARAVGIRWAGVDLITPNPAIPLEEAGGAILEVNTTPCLYYHYIRGAEPAPVAHMIVERLMASAP